MHNVKKILRVSLHSESLYNSEEAQKLLALVIIPGNVAAISENLNTGYQKGSNNELRRQSFSYRGSLIPTDSGRKIPVGRQSVQGKYTTAA